MNSSHGTFFAKLTQRQCNVLIQTGEDVVNLMLRLQRCINVAITTSMISIYPFILNGDLLNTSYYQQIVVFLLNLEKTVFKQRSKAFSKNNINVVNFTSQYQRRKDVVSLTSRFQRCNNVVNKTFIVRCELNLLFNVEAMLKQRWNSAVVVSILL